MTLSVAPGKILLTLNGLITAIGPFMADWSETHVLNPRWPPHAKFHNGQTMSMGLILGVSTIYYTWRTPLSPLARKDSLNTALLTSCAYYIAGMSAILYPDTKWLDPEFGEGHPQVYLFSLFMGIGIFGWWLEKSLLSKQERSL